MIKVFVGTAKEQELATKVLEFSILKHTNESVNVFPMTKVLEGVSMPVKKENRPKTPFSFQRFTIPKLANFSGKAIYLDSDMIVFDDIAKLWGTGFEGNDLLTTGNPHDSRRKLQYSVMLLNCETLKWDVKDIVRDLNEGKLNYQDLMYEMCLAPKVGVKISTRWNSLEHYEANETKLLHYTDMPKQPWVSIDNANGHLWCELFLESVKSGHITRDEVINNAKKGWIRPSLVYQLEQGISDPDLVRTKARELDADFVPPWKKLKMELRKSKQQVPFFKRITNKVISIVK